MKRTFLIKQVLLLLAGFAAINLVVAMRAYRTVPRLRIHTIDTSPPVTDLFVGNSLFEAGLDVPTYEAGVPGSRALNAALAASTTVEHDLLLRRSLRTAPRRVYYGFLDTQLTDGPVSRFDELTGNRAIVHYLERETAIRFLCPGDPLTAWRIRLVSWLPVVVERLTLWSRVERARRWLGGIGMPAQAESAFGRAADFSLIESDDDRKFARGCADLAARGAAWSAPVADMVTLAHHAGAVFCFVEMPMPSAHRRRFYATPEWAAYESALRKRAEQDGNRFINAVDWVGDDGFEDPIHLSPQGAVVFSHRLAVTR